MATVKKLKLKLFIEKKTQKVLFAEAGSDVVDLLFSLLSLPIASVIKLLPEESMVGCLGTTYSSLVRLDSSYFVSTKTKSQLYYPTSSKAVVANSLLLSGSSSPIVTTPTYYKCTDCNTSYLGSIPRYVYISDVFRSVCPTCQKLMCLSLRHKERDKYRFVKKRAVAYTITDDLSVAPMSTTSSITLFSSLGVNDLRCIEERTVSLGPQEGLELVKASLQSKNVLTDVFLSK